ncbi:MAG TPA: hypothetical protein VJA23_01780 [Candidatus Nanoarchaeia archaeon]|nr:hypothetical protein [Candidatus Nanoarchaeia archaeon]
MTSEVQLIMEKLNHIELDLSFIKKHISDLDQVLTDDDKEAIQEAKADLRAGKTKRLN